MLVCNGGKILTSTCGAMLGLNGFAAFLTLVASGALLAAAAWRAHVYDARLHEYWAALQKAEEDPDAADSFATLSPDSAAEWSAALLGAAPRAAGAALGACVEGLWLAGSYCMQCLLGAGKTAAAAAAAADLSVERLRRDTGDPNLSHSSSHRAGTGPC